MSFSEWFRKNSHFDSLLTLLCVGFICLTKISDRDYWTHLALGSEFVRQKTIFITEPFIQSLSGQPVDAAEWPFQIGLVGIRYLFSDAGVSVFVALTAVAAAWFVTRLMSDDVHDGRRILALLVTIGIFVIGRQRYAPRPEIVSNVLMCGSLVLGHGFTRRPRLWTLVALVAIFAVWRSMHVTWSIGAFFVLLLFLGTTITVWRDLAKSPWGKVVVPLFASGCVVAIIDLIQFGLHVLASMGKAGRMTSVIEMRPLWEFSYIAVPYACIGIILLAMSFGGRDKRIGRLVFWAAAFLFGAMAARNYLMGMLLMGFIGMVGLRTTRPINLGKFMTAARLSLVPAILVPSALALNSLAPSFGVGLDAGVGVIESANFVKNNKLPEPIFNNVNIGGCLNFVWQGNPKTFIDGRALGSQKRIDEFRAIMEDDNSRFLLSNLGIKTFISTSLATNSAKIYPVVMALMRSADWTLVNATDALVFVRTDSLGKVPALSKDAGWDFVDRETDLVKRKYSGMPFLPYNKGIVQLMKGNIPEARKLFIQAAKEQPGFVQYHKYYFRSVGLPVR